VWSRDILQCLLLQGSRPHTLLCARSLCCGLQVQSVDLLEDLAVIPLAHVGAPLFRTGRKWRRRGRCVWTRLASSGSRCGCSVAAKCEPFSINDWQPSIATLPEQTGSAQVTDGRCSFWHAVPLQG